MKSVFNRRDTPWITLSNRIRTRDSHTHRVPVYDFNPESLLTMFICSRYVGVATSDIFIAWKIDNDGDRQIHYVGWNTAVSAKKLAGYDQQCAGIERVTQHDYVEVLITMQVYLRIRTILQNQGVNPWKGCTRVRLIFHKLGGGWFILRPCYVQIWLLACLQVIYAHIECTESSHDDTWEHEFVFHDVCTPTHCMYTSFTRILVNNREVLDVMVYALVFFMETKPGL